MFFTLHSIGNRLRNEELLQPRTAACDPREILPFLSELSARTAAHGAPYRCSETTLDLLSKFVRDEAGFVYAASRFSDILYSEIPHARLPSIDMGFAVAEIEWQGKTTPAGIIFAAEKRDNLLASNIARLQADAHLQTGHTAAGISKTLLYLPEQNELYLMVDAANKALWLKTLFETTPLLTEKLKGRYAGEIVKSVSQSLKTEADADAFRKSVQQLVNGGESFEAEELAARCRQFVTPQQYQDAKKRIEEKMGCEIPDNVSLATDSVHKKLSRFTKSVQLGSDIALTITGKQEIESIVRLSADPATGTYIVKFVVASPAETPQ